MTTRRQFLAASASLAVLPRFAGAAPDKTQVQAAIDKACDYLKTRQQANGSFVPRAGEPGLTALVVAGMIRGGKPVTDAVVGKVNRLQLPLPIEKIDART